MKKRVLIIISAILLLLISNLSVHAELDLGKFVGGPEIEWMTAGGISIMVSTFYY